MTGRRRAWTKIRSRDRALALSALIASLILSLTVTAGLAAAVPATPPPSESPTQATPPPSTDASVKPSSADPAPPPVPSAPPSDVVPPAARNAAQRYEAEVTVAFDKATYQSGDLIKVDFTVKNVSSERLTRVRVTDFFDKPDALVVDPNQWAEFGHGEGLDLDPGAARTVKLSGHTKRADSESVRMAGFVYDHTGMGITEFTSTAPVTRTYGRASGIVFADRNGSGTFEPGEELPGAPLTWQYAYHWEGGDYKTTTDANGRFSFPNIPATRYWMPNAHVDGWTVLMRTVDVDQSDMNDNLRVRAVKPVRGELTAEMKFAKDSYAPGDLAHITVTLTNSGTIPLTGIAARCNGAGFNHGLWGTGPGWGDLSLLTDGVTLQAGQTRTFDVTDTVPDAAFATGYVFVGCGFGYVGDDNGLDMPGAGDDALVPGGIGAIAGGVAYYPEGQGYGKPSQPIEGIRVVLVDKRPCHLAEQLTDKDGRFEFANLPAGRDNYSLYFYPPAGWMMDGVNPQTRIQVMDGDTVQFGLAAKKGGGQLPALPAEAAECGPGSTTPTEPPATDPPPAPAPQAKAAATRLADTGADVTVAAALGVLTVLLGSGLIVATRRRGVRDTSRQ